jgi:uncharacterized protein
MIIDLKTVLHGPRQFDLTLDPDWWKNTEEDDQIRGLCGPLTVSIKISQAGGKYLLEGRMAGSVRIRCDRCLELFEDAIESQFQLFLALARSHDGQSEVELLEDDMSVNLITGEEISLDDIVREQIYLSLPMKCLCSQDCSGLCPFCGANLNIETCNCRSQAGHPGFSKLKRM